jgi:hypothetical protein
MQHELKVRSIDDVKSLIDELNRDKNITKPYLYGRLQNALAGTGSEFLLKAFDKCTTYASTQKFLYNCYLCLCGLAKPESQLSIKSYGKHNFETPQKMKVELSDKNKRQIETKPIYA